jgi:hypothetical protein
VESRAGRREDYISRLVMGWVRETNGESHDNGKPAKPKFSITAITMLPGFQQRFIVGLRKDYDAWEYQAHLSMTCYVGFV